MAHPGPESGVGVDAAAQVALLSADPRLEVIAWDGATPMPVADLVVYHVGNSRWNYPVVKAAAIGPPGVLVVHDGTIHHLVESAALGAGDEDAYVQWLSAAHGERGARVATARLAGRGGEMDRALLDGLAPILRRHRAAIVHSSWTARLVRHRAPGLPVSVVPLAVEPPARKLSRTLLGASPGEDLVGHVGYLTPNKRPELMIDAFARLLVLRPASRLVILGADRTNGALADALAAEPAAAARTTVTGYVPDGLLAGLVAALDVVIAFRGPHLGESSGPSATALAQGVPLVTQRIGAWADLPREVALWVPVGPDEPYSLARTLDAVLDDPELRGRLSRAGREYATRELGWSRIAAATAEIILQSRDLPPLSDLTAPPLPEWPPDGSGRDFEPYALGLADGTVVGFGAPISENRCPGFPPMVDGRPRRDPVDDPTPTEGAPWIARVSLADGEHLVAADGRIRTPAGEIDDGLVADVRFPLVDAAASPDRDGILMTDAHGHLFGFGAARAPAGLRRSPTRPVVAVAYATADSLLSQD